MAPEKPKTIGLLIGREWSWPSAFIAEINRREEKVTADFIKIGETTESTPILFDVIVDRMSNEIPYYRTFLKYAALNGCYVINNPLMYAADDKFFGVALANRLGISTPRTLVLPNKRVETENVPESFRNLIYPMNWQGIIDYVGVPAILKDTITGGRRMARRVHNLDELLQAYDESDSLTVLLQEVIESDHHIHCFVIGQEMMLALEYDVQENRYSSRPAELKPQVDGEIKENALKVTRAYGYDINMVEYVIHEGRPCLINPTNPTPDLDINLLTSENFNWCINTVADFAIRMARHPRQQYSNHDWHKALANKVTKKS
jgi:glutathione synthase/RimK-type ligase-like ATP-grasp enzyme